MIAVVDYEVGNIKSVMFALRRLGREAVLTADPAELEHADGVVLPGVGAFGEAMESLRRSGLAGALREAAAGGPLLGICLGHQLLFSESEEHGRHEGLGLIEGRVRRFPPGRKVPHMGWNQVHRRGPSPLLDGIEDGAFMYFAHSFYAAPRQPQVAVGVTDYGEEFASMVDDGAGVMGTQFHPEKSGPVGQRILSNFCRLCEERS